jgi:hypothetical protein
LLVLIWIFNLIIWSLDYWIDFMIFMTSQGPSQPKIGIYIGLYDISIRVVQWWKKLYLRYFEEQKLCLESLKRLNFQLTKLNFWTLPRTSKIAWNKWFLINIETDKWFNMWTCHSSRCTWIHFFIHFMNKNFSYSPPTFINSHLFCFIFDEWPLISCNLWSSW